jgi:hypothetical protein
MREPIEYVVPVMMDGGQNGPAPTPTPTPTPTPPDLEKPGKDGG